MDLLFQTKNLIEWGGIALIIILIFAETGLLLGLIVPGGETLVFTSGLLVSTGTLDISIVLFFFLLALAAICGDSAGYYIGRRFGKKLYHKKDTWYFKKQYLHMAHDYIERHKKTSIIAGKFFPVVRPFTPVIAGITRMPRRNFYALTLLAVILYLGLFLFTGYFLGNKFPDIKNYLGFILPASVILLLVPVFLQIRKNKRRMKTKENADSEEVTG
ncbi:MAG TPA: DedA family protein [Flavisolibacter sp.]|jgi:membrane-associated protein|nr:DedA family protein [Flavisolibacter sp.]